MSSRSSWSGAVWTSSRFAEVREQIAGDVAQVVARLDEPVDRLERAAHVADRDDVGDLDPDLALRRAEQRPHDRLVDRRAAEHRRLVQQRQRVARRALRLSRDRVRGDRVERDALGLGDR